MQVTPSSALFEALTAVSRRAESQPPEPPRPDEQSVKVEADGRHEQSPRRPGRPAHLGRLLDIIA